MCSCTCCEKPKHFCFCCCFEEPSFVSQNSKGSFNSEAFKEGLIALHEKLLTTGMVNPVFFMDNARIHHYQELRATIENLGLNIQYLPPYSPFLNPIENVFSI
ncbi:hypothetical protein EHP00_1368 [Ecytonucleospora hepatopenaei]|uniref:Tc1-like transposase DDE domain-containing protein n=1 Tax=Ecytonucleospora hepatopenaei TaxID=646526 RepID=A0A1W0E2X8_9MICR|nr:hypothetical protein EHP00_1368 [Ecytonucleospora hepatopenaei]